MSQKRGGQWATCTETDRMIEYIEAHPGSTLTEIAAGLGKVRDSLSAPVADVVRRRLVLRVQLRTLVLNGRVRQHYVVWHYFTSITAAAAYQTPDVNADDILRPWRTEQNWRNLGEAEIRREMEKAVARRFPNREVVCA